MEMKRTKGGERKKNQEGDGSGREKVRQGDGKCSGEKRYLCLSVVSTVGRLLKGSLVHGASGKKRAAVWKTADGTKSPKLAH